MMAMMMEAREEVAQCKDHLAIMKGKRTKRHRAISPLTLAVGSSSFSGEESGGELREMGDVDRATPSSSPFTSLAESTVEEEDMANCLILLAQGHKRKDYAPANIAGDYKCKTCERSFSSFQALGGHRASHKKPRVMVYEEKNKTLNFVEEVNDQLQFSMSTALSLQITNRGLSNNITGKSYKVHECSICGAKFSSGQALGGHMRRHRPVAGSNVGASSSEQQKSRNLLQLDLNLPAPEEESKFSFGSKEKLLVFSASSLVDCHY